MLAFLVGASGTNATRNGAKQIMRGGAKAPLTILLAGLSLAGPSAVDAARLGKDACYELRVELGMLRAAGVEEDMKLGPEWARINLTRDELKNVQRLVEVEEQLRFRCGSLRGRLVAKKPRVIPAPDTPLRKPSTPKAAAKVTPPASKKAATTSPTRKRTSVRRKRRRAKATATAPGQAVLNSLGGVR